MHEEKNKNLLLHICCAPDGTVPVHDLKIQGWNDRGFFYGNNIHPENEYLKRLSAIKILAEKNDIDIITPEYNPDEWLNKIKISGLESEPEGGRRCEKCFNLQFEAVAQQAVNLNFKYFCTTLTISPHKNVNLILKTGDEISQKYNLNWLGIIWRKNNGFLRSIKFSKEFNLYRQNYCGCVYSIREPVNSNTL